MKKVVALFILFLLTIPCAQADIAGGAVDAISSGIEKFVFNVADEILSWGIFVDEEGSGLVKVSDDSLTNRIYSLGSYSPNPYAFEPILELQRKIDQALFIPVAKLILGLAAICFLLDYFAPMLSQRIFEITEFHAGAALIKYMLSIMMLVLIVLTSNPIVYYILALNDALTKEMFMLALPSLDPTQGGAIQYLMMAIAWVILAVFYAWRILIIFMVAIIIRTLLALYIFPRTRDFAENTFIYFIQIVFFQLIMMTYFVIGIVIITLFWVIPLLQFFLYLAMILGGIFIGFKLVFGINLFKTAARGTKYVIIKGL